MADQPPHLRRRIGTMWRDAVAVVLLAGALFGTGLAGGTLRDWDEAIYAQVAWEMASGGDWVTLRYDGRPWFHKAPLVFWASAAGYLAFGKGELAPRLPAAAAGVLAVLLTLLWGSRSWGRAAGWIAAVVLATSPLFVKLAKTGMLDVPLTAASTAAMAAWWRAGRDPRWLIACGAGLGVAGLVKGLAVAPVAVALLVHMLVGRRLGWLRSPWLWGGAALALAILAPWHVAMSHLHGGAFWGNYVGYHVIDRATAGIGRNVLGGPAYYVQALLEGHRPWVLLSVPALALGLREAWRAPTGLPALLAVWAAVGLAVPSLMKTQLDWYVLPAYVPLALLSAWLVVTRVAAARQRLAVTAIAVVALANLASTQRAWDLDYSAEARILADAARPEVPEGDAVAVFDFNHPALRFYLERRVVRLPAGDESATREALDALLSQQHVVYVFSRAPAAAPLAHFAPTVVARAGERALMRIGSRPRGAPSRP